ncbi:hypothetical protein D8I24_0548 (plasmid) [Cupriavidus necator H850]|uniref:ABC transporter substrate-binding protein n=1 Tax=Cupriavidus necator TaxID=106590 RepID=UPI00129DB9AB|nr:ABC transporter substrate-binding protein [Cupriavidus necator]KAI3610286.1 hypothetical protein D8I24_0548 [Cupriavidus necator H850]
MRITTHRAGILALALAGSLGASVQAAEVGGVFRFGVPYPQSGGIAEYGANYSDGIRMAVQEINGKGGITVGGQKVKVEAVFCDTQADTSKAAACGRRLSAQERVRAMLISTSLETFPLMSFNNEGKSSFLIISSSASNKLVALNNPLVARYWFNTYSYMAPFNRALKDALATVDSTSQTVAIMQSEDEFGKAWADTFWKGWTSAGGTLGQTATYASMSTDFYPQLTALLKNKPGILAVPGPCPQVAPIVKQARELGFTGRFIFQVSCGPEEIVKSVGERAIAGSIFEGSEWDLKSARLTQFREAFKKMFKREAVVISADGYAQAMWLFSSVQAAASLDDPKKIRAAMGPTLNQDWNILGIKDLQSNGETTAAIHPRIFKALNNIVDYTGNNAQAAK